jgi:hypothetical protein
MALSDRIPVEPIHDSAQWTVRLLRIMTLCRVDRPTAERLLFVRWLVETARLRDW